MSKNKFLLPWESGATKGSFGKAIFRPSERVQLAKSMSYDQILNTTEFVEDLEARRRFRWKAIRNFYGVVRQDKYKYCNMERALWSHQGTNVTAHHFVAAMMAEYDFELHMYYDRQLEALYLSFDGGKYDKADWRDILANFKVIHYFRLVKEDPLELFMILFDIYTAAENTNKNVKKDDYILYQANEYVRRILLIPCLTDYEVGNVDNSLVDLFIYLKQEKNTITHRRFKHLLTTPEYNHILKHWAATCWDRLPTELRLVAYDEAQMRHKDNAEIIMMHHKLSQAMLFNNKTICRRVYKEWKLEMLRESGVRKFISRVLLRKRYRFFKFWDHLTTKLRMKRRKRYLADVMGNYSLKARMFYRIKLFNYNERRLYRLVGNFDKTGRCQKLGGYYLREYSRRSRLRKYFHNWWNKCVDMINLEMVIEHDNHRILRTYMLPWYRYAHEKELLRRAEEVARENQLQFDRMMEEAEASAQEIMRLEQERKEKAEREEAERKRIEQEERIRIAAERRAKQKQEEKDLLMAVQKEERRRRVKKVMKKMKAEFKAEWDEKTDDVIQRAKNRITAYIENKDNRLAIDMNFEQLKREFFQPPTPENPQREVILSSIKNIAFLHLQAKLREELIDIQELVPRFDEGHKGYLTYSEFKTMLGSIGVKITPAQMSAIIRGVDVDGDKCIELKELENSLAETDIMGTPGSVWRYYIDPAENVMTYHNFATGERIFDYQMKDKKLREIAIENMYGEADHMAVQEVHDLKKKEWEDKILAYMASRIQYMYRQRKMRKWREKKMWKLTNHILRAKSNTQRKCVRFLETAFIGWQKRELFKRQLKYAFEKVWDVNASKLFWYNTVTQEASWDRPYILGRYDDVDAPSEWVSSAVEVTSPEMVAGRRTFTGQELLQNAHDDLQVEPERQYVITYWHVLAKRGLPRKPDGLPLCGECQRNIGVHYCKTCMMDYCLPCHRGTHSNPFGFHQCARASKAQYSDPVFLQRLAFHPHPFTLSQPKKCDMCKTKGRLLAGIRCDHCAKNMCRDCSARIHQHGDNAHHVYYQI